LGDTLIGRSEECDVTIFDPSVSRRHACIRIFSGRVVLEDLGSRNGCRVNGVPVKHPVELADGDRIRFGTQELVFSDMQATSDVHRRITRSLCYCGSCRAAYGQEVDRCPHCGSTKRIQYLSASQDGIDAAAAAGPSSRRR
jgi:predicted component of type VI protein secretion system